MNVVTRPIAVLSPEDVQKAISEFLKRELSEEEVIEAVRWYVSREMGRIFSVDDTCLVTITDGRGATVGMKDINLLD